MAMLISFSGEFQRVLLVDRVPQQLQVEALAADEFLLHLLGTGFSWISRVDEVDVQGAVVVAADHRLQFVGEFLEHLCWAFRTLDVRFRFRSWSVLLD